jgi:hypothetical protein
VTGRTWPPQSPRVAGLTDMATCPSTYVSRPTRGGGILSMTGQGCGRSHTVTDVGEVVDPPIALVSDRMVGCIRSRDRAADDRCTDNWNRSRATRGARLVRKVADGAVETFPGAPARRSNTGSAIHSRHDATSTATADSIRSHR